MSSILYSVPVEWFEIRQRFHYLAEILAERHDLQVMAPRSHQRLVREKRWAELARPYSVAPLPLRGNVYSVATLPFYRRHPALVMTQWRLNPGCLAKAARAAGGYFDVLWLADPTQAELVDRVPHRLLIYECVDDHAGFWPQQSLKDHVNREEERLARRADLVIATSVALEHRLSAWNPQVIRIPNGTDLPYFTAVAADPGAFNQPEDLASLPAPRIGFYGALGNWVDLELIRQVAEARPQWQVVLIGPAFADVSTLQALPNVHWLGPKPFEALRSYLAHIPVWLIPFKVDAMTAAVDPLKAYEYLAAARRVVTTPLPELEPMLPFVRMAQGAEEWVRVLEATLAAGPLTGAEREALSDRLARRDWPRLAAEFERVMLAALEARALEGII